MADTWSWRFPSLSIGTLLGFIGASVNGRYRYCSLYTDEVDCADRWVAVICVHDSDDLFPTKEYASLYTVARCDRRSNGRWVMRDEVKLYKRTRIVEEASKLFYERGYDATSVDMLAGELGVTKPFIYSYFDNKRAILEAVHEQAAHRVFGHIEKAMQSPGPPDERLQRFIEIYVDENIKHQIASGIYLQEEKNLSPEFADSIKLIERKFNKILADLIQEGIRSGIYLIQDAKLASLCISGMVRWVHRWYKPGGRLEPAEISATISEFALNMLGRKKKSRKKADRTAAGA